jgi:hypothetical protein
VSREGATVTLDQVLAWVGLAGTVIGIGLAVMFYLWQKREKRPVYAKRNVPIVKKAKETFPALEIHYRGHGGDHDKLDNLSVTMIAIWNEGRETVQGSDIAAAAPLTVKGEGEVKILGASVVQMNNTASLATCSYNKKNNAATLTFDYLDYRQGLVVEVLHTGTTADGVKVEGTFKGCGEIKPLPGLAVNTPSEIERRNWGRRFRFIQFTAGWFIAISSLVMLGSMLLTTHRRVSAVVVDGVHYVADPAGYSYEERNGALVAVSSTRWTTTVAFPVMLLLVSLTMFVNLRLSRVPTVPRGLEQYDERL